MPQQARPDAGSTLGGAPRFHIQTFGCRVNRVESDAIAAALIGGGWQRTDRLDRCDLAIVNTCTVTGEADRKNRKAINQALVRMTGPVVVTGCSANIGAAGYEVMSVRVHVETDKTAVPSFAQRLLGAKEGPSTAAAPFGPGFRARGGIKIQDGCNNACSFCIVHVARGPARSVPVQRVIADARTLVQAGAEELVLTGIDSGAYASDGLRLSGLIERILDETGVKRLRLGSIEPHSIDPCLIRLLAEQDGRVCRHLHVAMQSGSTKVLSQMARRYSAEEFAMIVERLYAEVPRLALSTDVIVGFPGETDEDFEQTCEMARRSRFMRLHVFPYSKRPGTPAAERKDQVPTHVKATRAAELAALGRELALADMQRRIGTVEDVVAEEHGRGTSESFHEVCFDSAPPSGKLVATELVDIDEASLSFRGRLLQPAGV